MRHRILLQTNPPWIKTGLAENAKTLLKYLAKTGKYDLAHYCTQTSVADGNLRLTPWKSYGCLPNDPRAIQELNADHGKAREAAYGAWNIDEVVKDFKPTIWIGSDDIWGFSKGSYLDKPWYKQINSILHITIDSVPILEQAYEQASLTKNYITWAKFAEKEMKKTNSKLFGHVSQIYGAMDTSKFAPIHPEERKVLRAQFNIPEDQVIFLFVGRNQLRKQMPHCIEAFAKFKKDYPNANAKLWFHTSFSEKGNGWDIPKMAAYYGVSLEDILCTYVCKHCGQWIVHSYRGEDIDCPYCKTAKSLVTANIIHGVPDDQMKYLYGISDACISAFSSGGQEYHSVQSLLCGKPLACTNYSCGEDFCEQSFVHKLGFTTYIEQGTNFVKSTTDIRDIKRFMHKVWSMPKRDIAEWGELGRRWAVSTFSIEAIGAKWEALFDSLPIVEWSSIDLKPEVKNENFPFPEIEDEDQFILTLYKEILKMNEPKDSQGFKDWKASLAAGRTRQQVYEYFISVARQDNAKLVQQDFSAFLDKTTGKKRGLILIKESIGDIMLVTSLFRSFHDNHPNTDLYVMADQKYHEILFGNEYIFKVLPYVSAFEQEMLAIGAGQKAEDSYFDYYYHTAIPTQRQLSYLSQPSPAFDLQYANSN
jgi:glycosyltransferase involved in cell wall biosynthesis